MAYDTIPKRHKNAQSARGALLLLVLLLTTSCASIEHARDLREAQDMFNSASALENQLKLIGPSQDLMIQSNQITTGYTASLAIVSYLIDEKAGALRSDHLLGSAYTLKALIEWRLAAYDDALRTRDEALRNASRLYPRDSTVLMVLPGLVNIDRANRELAHQDSSISFYNALKTMLIDAIDTIGSEVNPDPEKDAIRLYLLASQAAALKNWQDAWTPMFGVDGFDADTELASWCAMADPIWNALTREVKRLDTDAARTFQNSLGLIPCNAESP